MQLNCTDDRHRSDERSGESDDKQRSCDGQVIPARSPDNDGGGLLADGGPTVNEMRWFEDGLMQSWLAVDSALSPTYSASRF